MLSMRVCEECAVGRNGREPKDEQVVFAGHM